MGMERQGKGLRRCYAMLFFIWVAMLAGLFLLLLGFAGIETQLKRIAAALEKRHN